MMNRLRMIWGFLSFLVFAWLPVHADDSTLIRTGHYEIAGGGDADQTGRRLEALFEVYNRVFMFDTNQGALPLKVRIFTDTGEYNNYVQSALAPANSGALYLHYAQSDRRELLIDHSDANAKSSLPYQAFIQYLRAFIAQPPLWMQKGFAAFFSALSFTPEGKLSLEENLDWLQTVKNMKSRPSLEDILLAEEPPVHEGGRQEFNSLACSLVSFFLNSGKEEYTRSFTDSLMTLSNENTPAQNAAAMTRRLFLGHGAQEMARDYEHYVDSRKTFAQLVAEGQRAYSSGDSTAAELSFHAAMEVKSGNFVPYYYLGLLAYDAGRFDMAQDFYLASIDNGADTALVLYALGLNAAASGKTREAADYLRRAAQAAPAQYREKSERIIKLTTNH